MLWITGRLLVVDRLIARLKEWRQQTKAGYEKERRLADTLAFALLEESRLSTELRSTLVALEMWRDARRV